jgi:HPt (histidine-containing phosphotransfer) domain-containing protein
MTAERIDRAAYAELQEAVGDEFAAELVETFLAEAPEMLDALRATAATGDVDGFRRAAHSIKSNATTFGATMLADHARRLELGGVDDALIAELETVYARTATALRDMLDGV